MIDYLIAPASKSDTQKDKGEVEYYINGFNDMAAEQVKIK